MKNVSVVQMSEVLLVKCQTSWFLLHPIFMGIKIEKHQKAQWVLWLYWTFYNVLDFVEIFYLHELHSHHSTSIFLQCQIMLPYQHRGVLDLLNFVRIYARLDWFSHSITIEMLDTKQPKFTETSTAERFCLYLVLNFAYLM